MLSEGTRVGDALWHGDELDEKARARIAALFRLTFGGSNPAAAPVGQEPIYLILAMTDDRMLRMKPQNLLTGLPVRREAAFS